MKKPERSLYLIKKRGAHRLEPACFLVGHASTIHLRMYLFGLSRAELNLLLS